MITALDLSRLITHVVLHDCENPNLLQQETFDQLYREGLVKIEWNDYGDVSNYHATDKGKAVVEAMIRAGIGMLV